MVSISALVQQCDAWLLPERFQDYAPNGLQVSGQSHVKKLAVAVSADLESIQRASHWGAEALLVHHGLFWRGQAPVITGVMRERLALLLQHGINLIAYHLPLDAHPTLGNNVGLAEIFGWEVHTPLPFGTPPIGLVGALPRPMSVQDFLVECAQKLACKPQHLLGGPDTIKRIAWCSGAAQDALSLAASMGVDAYVSGEVSERTFYEARELGVHYFALGHHATEKIGVQKLAEALASEYDVVYRFFDAENPI
jgi:dinuclear metal center YbgI/SA1388 family protein